MMIALQEIDADTSSPRARETSPSTTPRTPPIEAARKRPPGRGSRYCSAASAKRLSVTDMSDSFRVTTRSVSTLEPGFTTVDPPVKPASNTAPRISRSESSDSGLRCNANGRPPNSSRTSLGRGPDPSAPSRRTTTVMTPSLASCSTVAGSQRCDAAPDTNPTERSPAVLGSVSAPVPPSSGFRSHETTRDPTATAAISEATSAISGSRAGPRATPDAAAESGPVAASAIECDT